MKKKYALMAALLLIVTTMAAAEKIKSFKLSTANGLPDNNIRTILQDRTGYLYLRSRYATYRYDGYGFRTVPDSIFDRLARQHTQRDGVDNMGNTYGVSDRGDVVYNDRRTGERLTFHVFDPRLRTLTHNIKVHIVTDGKDHVWISTNGYGVCVYNRRTRTLRRILRDDAERLIDSNYIVAMFLDHQGNVWVSQEHYGLACLSIVDTGRSISLCGDGGEEQRHNVRMVRRISGGRLLMADNDGTLYESDGSLGHIRTVQSHGDNFLTAMSDNSGRLWLGSRLRGINVDGQWVGTGRIDCIMEDSRGRIWACGVRNDVWAVSADQSKRLRVAHFFSKDIVPRQMIQDHRGDIWLACLRQRHVCVQPRPTFAQSEGIHSCGRAHG